VIDLAAGRHKLRFTSAGKPAGSTGFSFGLDAIDLPLPPAKGVGEEGGSNRGHPLALHASPVFPCGAYVKDYDVGMVRIRTGQASPAVRWGTKEYLYRLPRNHDLAKVEILVPFLARIWDGNDATPAEN
jgi:hypothetical protein